MKAFPLFSIFIVLLMVSGCQNDRLERISYNSQVDGEERDFFLYLPNGYGSVDKEWPVLLFLHGNGERGNGKDELDFVKIHGPLYEAWIQKRNLPFIIIAPQLHMFGMDEQTPYLADRDTSIIPKRLSEGVPPRPAVASGQGPLKGATPEAPDYLTLPNGWNLVEDDLVGILNHVQNNYRTDETRIYLSGISYGGFGVWHLASSHPELFAAINPIVGWGHPDLMEPIARHNIPVWAFASGRDAVIEPKYFYEGLNRLEELGHNEVRFTIHEDMAHDAWKRIYGGDDIYSWLLKQNKIQTKQKELLGSWSDESGHILTFRVDGSATWNTMDETDSETRFFSYSFDPSQDPASITFSNFSSQPYGGNTLSGTITFQMDRNSFELMLEEAIDNTALPENFDLPVNGVFHRNE